MILSYRVIDLLISITFEIVCSRIRARFRLSCMCVRARSPRICRVLDYNFLTSVGIRIFIISPMRP